MIEMLNKRRKDGEEGFTLIELMVVVLIIGILLAIAVPTFLSAQKNAKNKAATSNVRSALSAVKTVYADKQTYAVTRDDLIKAEPSLDWAATSGATVVAADSPQKIGWTAAAGTMTLVAKSKLNVCFWVKDDTATGTTYARAAGTTCDTDDMPTAPDATTNTKFGTSADAWSE
ncbi:MAG TPA: type II secretion system protein [Acidimicrobiales bacterium]|nr:type II secretion system protein [Acidimicrobiales bacterium]